jgi:hypothetical protein
MTGLYQPSLYEGKVAWAEKVGSRTEIFYWDGTNTIQITNNSYNDLKPVVYDGTIAWRGANTPNYEIYYWDGSTTTLVFSTVNSPNGSSISLYDGKIAYVHLNDIYIWDGTSSTQITNNGYINRGPSLYEDTMAWWAHDGNYWRIYYWDGTNTIPVTDSLSFDAGGPSLYDSNIAFTAYPSGKSQLYYAELVLSPPITDPSDGTTDVSVDTNITATFSDDIDSTTVDTNSFFINGVAGSVSYDIGTKTATFTPTSDLNYNSTYTASITTDVEDLDGNVLAADYTWSFTTGSAPDTTAPTANSNTPLNDATDVPVDATISVTFSEDMDASTIDTNSFTLDNGVTGTISYDSNSTAATFTPSADLNYNTTYTVTITTGVEDLSGNPLQADYTFSFTTEPPPDIALPTIIGTLDSGIGYWDVAASEWTQMTASTPIGDIAAGDFTGDGKADVASCWGSGLWYQDGATLSWIKVSGSAPNSLTAGDVTGDGQAEIIGTWSSGVWYWDVAASIWTQMTVFTPTGDIAAGDFTGEGRADVASIWDNGLWYQDGATLDWTKVSNTAPTQLTAGDVTGDGRSEIIGTWSSGVWYWDVAVSKWTKMTASTPIGDIAAGDFTGDGKADVASCWGSGLWYQDGATLDWTKVSNTAPTKLTAGEVSGN